MEVCTVLFVRSQVFRHMRVCCSVAVSDIWKGHCVCKLRARMSKKTGLLDPWKVKELCFSEYWKPVTQQHNVESRETWKFTIFLSHRAFCSVLTHQQMHIYMLFNKSKIYNKTLKTPLHVSIIWSSSGSIHCPLLNLQFKNTQWFTSLCWVGAVAACLVYCVSCILFRMNSLLITECFKTVTLARNSVCSLRMIVWSKHVGAFYVF